MKTAEISRIQKAKTLRSGSWKKDFHQNKALYLIFLPVLVYFFIFHYLPMFGIVMSFRNYNVRQGIFGSQWVGMGNFARLFSGDQFPIALRNTVIIGLFNLVLGFSAPLIFALLITQVRQKRFRKFIQICTYMPNFVASMVICTLLIQFLGPDGAITNLLTNVFGLEPQNWLANANPPVFWLIYSISGAWQSFGYGSIIYVAAICSISDDLFEAASLDGAGRWQKIKSITIPAIMPTIIMLLTLQIGVVFKAGFDRILLLYMPSTYAVSDTLYSYTYRMAFGASPDFGLSAASGLFQSVVGTVLLFLSNWLNRKVAKTSLF